MDWYHQCIEGIYSLQMSWPTIPYQKRVFLGVNVTINQVGDDKNSNFTAEMMTI
jgi:hypothetical protein